jgi:hypothetical protein
MWLPPAFLDCMGMGLYCVLLMKVNSKTTIPLARLTAGDYSLASR